MALLDFLFKNNKIEKNKVQFKTLNDSFFKPFGSNFLNSETFLTCVRTNASYASKIKVQSIREVEGERVHDYPELDYLLQVRPNQFMNAATFYERLSEFYDLYNNVFVYIQRDELYKIIGLWSIDPSGMQIARAENGQWLCRFDVDGKMVTESYSSIIHIARDVIASEIWGENSQTIAKILDLINFNYQGLEKAIKTSGILRYIAQVTTKMSKSELKKKAKDFTDTYLKAELGSEVGIAFVDSLTEIEPMPERTQKIANFREAEELDNKVYNYLQCPKKIVDGSASLEEKANYIEVRLGTFMIKLKQEMDYKLFTRREYGFNNRIQVDYDAIKYASLETKIKFFTATREHGLMTKGDVGKLFDIDVPSEVKDQLLISQNYMQSVNNNNNNNNDDGGKNEDGNKPKPAEE